MGHKNGMKRKRVNHSHKASAAPAAPQSASAPPPVATGASVCQAPWCKCFPTSSNLFNFPRPVASSKLESGNKGTREEAEAKARHRQGLFDAFMLQPPFPERAVYCKDHCERDADGEPIKGSILHYSNAPINNNTGDPRRNNEKIKSAPSTFTKAPTSAPSSDVAHRAKRAKARDVTSTTEGDLTKAAARIKHLEEELAKVKSERDRAESLCVALKDAKRNDRATPTYEALVDGELMGSCRSWTNLEPGGLECLVESMVATGLNEAYNDVIKAKSHYKKELLGLGMKDAATLVVAKCALGVNNTILADLFGLSDQRVASDAFKHTLFICCFWAEQILAVVPDLAQLREDALPAFKNSTFTNALLTFDATNTNITKPSSTQGRRETFSDYYGACCGKWEMISTLDGTPAWVSYTFGGRASERDIMCGSDWAKFFKECTEKWKLKGKSGKAIPIICLMDKGTRMEKEVKKEGGKSLTPTQLKDNFVSLKDSARNEHVSKARGHVERAIGRVKRNRILAGAVHHSLLPLLDDIVFFCVFSTHLVAPTEAGEGGDDEAIAACFLDESEDESSGSSSDESMEDTQEP